MTEFRTGEAFRSIVGAGFAVLVAVGLAACDQSDAPVGLTPDESSFDSSSESYSGTAPYHPLPDPSAQYEISPDETPEGGTSGGYIGSNEWVLDESEREMWRSYDRRRESLNNW